MIVDAHSHVVGADRRRYPLDRVDLPGGSWVDAAPDASAFLQAMSEAGVDRAVLVQPHGAYRYDNRYVVDAARTHLGQLVAMGSIDVMHPAATEHLESLVGDGLAGLRVFSIPTPAAGDRWLNSVQTEQVLAVARRRGLVVSVCVLGEQLDELVALAGAATPEDLFLVDHAAFVDLTPGSRQLATLADTPNLVLKITTHVLDHHRTMGLEPDRLLAQLADTVGPDRLVWGSDWAQTHDRPYPELVALGRRATRLLDPGAADAFLGGNSQRLFRLD